MARVTTGPRKLIYDGKTAVVVLENGKKYASLPVPDTIDGMMHVLVGHFSINFPLADFLVAAPDKAFLTGVTAGREVGSATIDGVPCRHLVFSQPPGIELELWLEANDQSLPRRLIVIYRTLPGEPNFVAEFSDWNFTVHPANSEFQFEPPEGSGATCDLVPRSEREQSNEPAGRLRYRRFPLDWQPHRTPSDGEQWVVLPAELRIVVLMAEPPFVVRMATAAVRGPYGGAAARGPARRSRGSRSLWRGRRACSLWRRGPSMCAVSGRGPPLPITALS